jgi:beta-xylosidase
LRTGLSWADWFRPESEAWFDRQAAALEEFETTLTLCFTPEHLGVVPHYTSPPKDAGQFAEFAHWAVSRYAQANCAVPPPKHDGMAVAAEQ